jgi:hypothetical protein
LFMPYQGCCMSHCIGFYLHEIRSGQGSPIAPSPPSLRCFQQSRPWADIEFKTHSIHLITFLHDLIAASR